MSHVNANNIKDIVGPLISRKFKQWFHKKDMGDNYRDSEKIIIDHKLSNTYDKYEKHHEISYEQRSANTALGFGHCYVITST